MLSRSVIFGTILCGPVLLLGSSCNFSLGTGSLRTAAHSAPAGVSPAHPAPAGLSRARPVLARRINEGNPWAQMELAFLYTNPEAYWPQDAVAAAKWFRHAADQGLATACHLV